MPPLQHPLRLHLRRPAAGPAVRLDEDERLGVQPGQLAGVAVAHAQIEQERGGPNQAQRTQRVRPRRRRGSQHPRWERHVVRQGPGRDVSVPREEGFVGQRVGAGGYLRLGRLGRNRPRRRRRRGGFEEDARQVHDPDVVVQELQQADEEDDGDCKNF